MAHKILILEDDYSFGITLQEWLKKKGLDATLVQSIGHAKREIFEGKYNLILSDLRLPDGDGILLLTWMKEQKKQVPIILMTNYAELQTAVAAIKLGAFDYLEKPINPSVIEQKIKQALESYKPNHPHTSFEKQPKDTTIIVRGKSFIAKKMYEQVLLVANTQLSVLIFGESGAGKEHIAKLIHDNSNRKNAPFIAVDCGSLLRELALSELFGHVKGSFTSAIADKKGIFELANGGTVFLDEIGNLPYEVQIQLLRTLQERKIHPVGSSENISIDVRILAATNESLETAIATGKFREDLYHRLKEFYIEVPALRERLDDISFFAEQFLKEANDELKKEVKRFSPEAMQTIKKYHWPGNLRELRNVIRSAVLYARTDEISFTDLPILSTSLHTSVADIRGVTQQANEKELIEATLRKMHGNKALTAKTLQISRKTLYNKIHSYGIHL